MYVLLAIDCIATFIDHRCILICLNEHCGWNCDTVISQIILFLIWSQVSLICFSVLVHYRFVCLLVQVLFSFQNWSCEPRLVAVSKKHPMSKVSLAYQCGVRHFGENYVQELHHKANALSDEEHTGIRWHLVGHLQCNKVKLLTGVSVFSLNVFTIMLHTAQLLQEFQTYGWWRLWTE